MRFMKKGIAIALAATMVIACAPANGVSAAKKPSVAKKASVEVGKTTTIKVKNSNKKAKVTWKTSKKTVAKITKAVKKGVKASATVKGIKEGKAKITATYKLGKKSTKLTCTVTVKKAATVVTQTPAANTQAPVVSPSASLAPSKAPEGTTGPTKTPRPTKTPSPVPTATPTAIPVDASVTFEAVSGGALRIDNSTYNCASGNSKYLADKDYVEVNDPDMETLGTWDMPETVKIKDGDIVSFRVQGIFKGDKTVRFWIGDGGNGGCTPIKLVNTVEEGAAIEEGKYPVCYKPDENDKDKLKEMVGETGSATGAEGVVRKDQMLLGADTKTGKFDVSFNFKAGTSQNDTKSNYSKFTLKAVIGQNINGLIVKNIYIVSVNGKPAAGESGGETGGEVTDPDKDKAGVDLSEVGSFYGQKGITYDSEKNSFVSTKMGGVIIPLGMTLNTGDQVKVIMYGTAPATGFRTWLATTANGDDNKCPDKAQIQSADMGVANGKEFKATYTYTSGGDGCDALTIKGPAGATWDSLTITKVIVEKVVLDQSGADTTPAE